MIISRQSNSQESKHLGHYRGSGVKKTDPSKVSTESFEERGTHIGRNEEPEIHPDFTPQWMYATLYGLHGLGLFLLHMSMQVPVAQLANVRGGV